MSYSKAAPFAQLLLIATSIKESVKALQKHPEGKQAFEAWMGEVDFDARYNTRYKDLLTDHYVPETMVLVTDSFGLTEDGRLYVETGYSTYIWYDGANGFWVESSSSLLSTRR